MGCAELVSGIKKRFPEFAPLSVSQGYPDEITIHVESKDFKDTCLALHTMLLSPVMMLFAADERAASNVFVIRCVFLDGKDNRWIIVRIDLASEAPGFESLAKSMHSATLFEREIKEMFGIEPHGNPDLRRLHLHGEVCPEGNYPLRKDFRALQSGELREHVFTRVEGEGIFEVPVGPVHAGIIGPGHFRFSVAGEPIINLELRLGFTHRGVEKLFEGKTCADALKLAECVSGDSSFAHGMAFSRAAEKISGIGVSTHTAYLRGIFLELERMYNHVNDIGGMAVDVGFSFPAAYASIIKEGILQLNEELTGSRYLKNVTVVGGIKVSIDEAQKVLVRESLKKITRDFSALVTMLYASVSFMDRVDTTGVLRRKTAEDLGVLGPAGRASGIAVDLRKNFPGVYAHTSFKMATQESGDVLARLAVRVAEFEGSCRLIDSFIERLDHGEQPISFPALQEGSALGYVEGWRGPVLYWLKTDRSGVIERCKVVDPSFRNWQGLSYAVLGNIIPDFPLCNKSFDLSYPGNDL